jgi:hypothetical protein
MLFSNSPVKKVVEKLNPFSQKNKISRLKFERKSDYRTFLKFIKDNTKEIEDIKIPDPEDKKRKGLMIGGGLLGLGLLAFAGGGKRDSDDGTGKLKSISGVIQKSVADSRKAVSGGKDRRKLDQADDALTKRLEKIDISKDRLKTQVKGPRQKRLINVKEYLEKRKNRKFKKVRKKYTKRIKKPAFSVNPTKQREFAGITGDTLDDNIKKTRRGNRTTFAGSDGDKKIGFPSKKDIEGEKKLTKKIFKSDVKKITSPKPGEKESAQDLINRLNRATKEADKIGKRAKEIDTKNTNKLRDSFKKSFNQPDASRVNPYNRFDPTAGFMDDDLGQRTGKTTDKVELKPPKKLTQFDKFNRFSNRILNSPAAKFTTFMGGLLANPKFMILKSLMEPTPLADGTMKGKPGVGVFSEQLMFDEDMAVNIFNFSEERESMIPFDTAVNAPIPSVTTPTDLQSPNNSVFIDYDFNTSEDLFFIKMAGS